MDYFVNFAQNPCIIFVFTVKYERLMSPMEVLEILLHCQFRTSISTIDFEKRRTNQAQPNRK